MGFDLIAEGEASSGIADAGGGELVAEDGGCNWVRRCNVLNCKPADCFSFRESLTQPFRMTS